MGVAARLPADDLLAIYGDAYYASASVAEGYSEYDEMADHSTSWAAAVVDCLVSPGQRVLDIGCADGRLLTGIATDVSRFGIEVAPGMAEVAARRGVTLVSRDLFDPVVRRLAGSMDVVSCIAVFEHLEDIRRGFEAAVDLLAPHGVLLFEVPLMTGGELDRTWLDSSLEHVWYPTARGLRHLAERGGHQLLGGEVVVRDYASTWAGLVSKDGSRSAELDRLWTRLTDDLPDDLSPEELKARALLHVVHAADTQAAELSLLQKTQLWQWPDERWSRLLRLWVRDMKRTEAAEKSHLEVVRYLLDVQRARDAAQASQADLERDVAELRRSLTNADVERDQIAREFADVGLEREELARDLAEAHLEYSRLALAHAEQVRALSQVYASTSWRVTAPVRALGYAKRRARHARLALKLVDKRRVRNAIALLRAGDVTAVRARARALTGQVELARSEPGEVIVRSREPWPQDLPFVSVVIPCFNYGSYVEDAVRSALDQTLERIEVIVVDGGSEDGVTPRVLRQLEEELSGNVRFLHRSGRHLAGDNRNFGIGVATGKYVCCLDADDVIDPTYLDLAVFRLERQAFDISSPSIRIFGRENRTIGVLERPDLKDMIEGNHITTAAVFRRSDWERAGGYVDTGTGPDHVFEDWRFWQRLVALGARVGNLSRAPLFGYRSHSDTSLSRDAAIPDLVRQRELVRAANLDVITPEALAESKRLRELEITVAGEWSDLAGQRPPPVASILLAVPFLLLGGAERMLSQVIAHLTDSGFRVVVVTTVDTDPSHGDTTSWFTRSTRDVFHLPAALSASAWHSFVQHLIESKAIDVLWLAGSEAVYAMLPALRRQNPQLRVVDLLFNTVGHVANNRRHRERIDLTLCENSEVADWLRGQEASAGGIRVIPNGVDIDLFAPADRERTLPLTVGYCGRLSEEKDPVAFLRLAARCDGLPLRFVMAGAGPLQSDVLRQMRRLRLRDRVEFLGPVADMPGLLQSLDLLVLPSRVDGRPNVVLEALASGVPILATRVGGLPEMVDDGETGWLWDITDGDAPIDFLRTISQEPGLLDELARAARAAAVARFSIERTHAAYEALFRELCPGTGSM